MLKLCQLCFMLRPCDYAIFDAGIIRSSQLTTANNNHHVRNIRLMTWTQAFVCDRQISILKINIRLSTVCMKEYLLCDDRPWSQKQASNTVPLRWSPPLELVFDEVPTSSVANPLIPYVHACVHVSTGRTGSSGKGATSTAVPRTRSVHVGGAKRAQLR